MPARKIRFGGVDARSEEMLLVMDRYEWRT